MADEAVSKPDRKRFPALGYRDFRVLWLGMVFASGTLAFQYYAQMWLIYELTDSAWALGVLGALRGLAMLIFGLYGGALADRMDRRMLLFITEAAALIFALVLGLLVVFGEVSLWLALLLIFFGAATASIDAPIRQALIPELVPQKHIPNAVALTTAAQMGSFAVMPVLAGFVIVWIGPGGAYLLSIVGNIGILIALVALRYRGTPRAARHEPVLRTIRQGIAYVRTQTIILSIIGLTFVTTAFGFALYLGLIVMWAGEVLGMTPGQYGLLAVTWGIGTLGAAYFMSWKGEIHYHGRILVVGSLIFGASFVLFGLVRSVPLAGLALFINGAAWTAAAISATAIVQRLVSNEVRGRVMSILMLSGAIAQTNSLLLGLGAQSFGIEKLLLGSTIFCTLAVAALILLVPTLRRLDRLIAEQPGARA